MSFAFTGLRSIGGHDEEIRNGGRAMERENSRLSYYTFANILHVSIFFLIDRLF